MDVPHQLDLPNCRRLVLPVHLLGRSNLAALLGYVSPVAGDVKLQDDGVVDAPVNRRGGGDGVGEDAFPLGEDQGGRYAQGSSFVALSSPGRQTILQEAGTTAVAGRGVIGAVQVLIGVDTHQDEHVGIAIDQQGVRLAERYAPATSYGYGELERWSRSLGEVRAFGIEGTGSCGAGLA